MILIFALLGIVAGIALIVFSGRFFGRRQLRQPNVHELASRDWSELSTLERGLVLGICLGLVAAFLFSVRMRGGGESAELLIYVIAMVTGIACAGIRKAKFNR